MPPLATDMEATHTATGLLRELMDMAVLAIMASAPQMLSPDTAMDMDTAMATTARDLRMPTTATEDTVDMVMDTVMATVMDTDTTDKKEVAAVMSR